jgi:hypothetical protein
MTFIGATIAARERKLSDAEINRLLRLGYTFHHGEVERCQAPLMTIDSSPLGELAILDVIGDDLVEAMRTVASIGGAADAREYRERVAREHSRAIRERYYELCGPPYGSRPTTPIQRQRDELRSVEHARLIGLGFQVRRELGGFQLSKLWPMFSEEHALFHVAMLDVLGDAIVDAARTVGIGGRAERYVEVMLTEHRHAIYARFAALLETR